MIEEKTLPRSYATERRGCFMPVYIPGETYSFFINTDYWITDPDYNNFILNIVNSNGDIISEIDPGLRKVNNNDAVVPSGAIKPYKLYALFVFPEVPTGTYFFTVYDKLKGIEKIRSNPILCEHSGIENTVRVWYKNSYNRNNINYDLLEDNYSGGVVEFWNMFRLPVSKIGYDNEADTETYRATTTNKFRTISSYLEQLHKVEFFKLDEYGFEGISDMLEHDSILFDMAYMTKKTALTSEINNATNLMKASFEFYLDQEKFEQGHVYGFGENIIMCGNAEFKPLLTINQNV